MFACRNHPDLIEGIRHCSRCGGPFCRDCLVTVGDRLYCQTCKIEQLRDLQSGVDRTRLNYAGGGRRFLALLLDRLIVVLPPYALFIILMIVTEKDGEPSLWPMLLLIPIIFGMPFYEALMMHYRQGQTLGKKALGLRVVRVDGSPITAGQAWGRAFLRLAFESCISIIDYIPAFFTDEKTTLHDMTAGTRVVDVR
jgi:uncharacterized RDD family membrane protein YckC